MAKPIKDGGGGGGKGGGKGGTGSTTDGPVTAPDSATIFEDNSVILSGLLDNDGGRRLRLESVNDSAAGASVTLLSDGTVLYDPGALFDHLAEGETATDTFTYTVSDRDGATSTETVTITIVGTNDAPVITGGETSGAVEEDGALVATGVLTADDVDASDALVWSVVGDGAGVYGALSIDADGAWTYTLDNASPAVQALAAGETATEVFTVEVSDGNGGVAQAEITVTVVGAGEAPTPPDATVLDFDDIATAGPIEIYDGFVFDTSGGVVAYESAAITIDEFAKEGGELTNAYYSETMTVMRADGADFDFLGAEFAAGSVADDLSAASSVTVEGWLDGALVHTTEVVLTADLTATSFDFAGIDELRFVSDATGGGGFGRYTVDDLIVA